MPRICSLVFLVLLFSFESGAQDLPPLVPLPQSMSPRPGSVAIDTSFTVDLGGAAVSDARVRASVLRFVDRLARQTGIPILPHLSAGQGGATMTVAVESTDRNKIQRLHDNERYSIDAGNGRIRLSSDGPLGAIRGLETLLQLVRQNAAPVGFSIPAVQIRDEPRFDWRGLSLDVSRHFMPFDVVERTLDGLAAVKLNVFHWHLSDDQGFRVESKKFPRLQQLSSDGLYYTQAQVRDVIAFARDRGIRVVPEFDMPGHMTSWFAAYPKYASGSGPYQIAHERGVMTALMDPSNEATYKFLDGFIGEMAKLFPDEYFHIGGDEVNPGEWKQNPKIQAFMRKQRLADSGALQAYFNRRVLKIVTRHGKRMEGWDEILHPDLPKDIVIQSWRGQESLAHAARDGYQGILSAGYYLDLMQPASVHYAIDPLKMPPFKAPADQTKIAAAREKYDRATAELASLTGDQKKRILGGEAAMWEELATSENIDAKLWPRLAAIAERLWSAESVTDPKQLYRRLEAIDRWLEFQGLTQHSSLELMRKRLAGAMDVAPLDTLAEVLEPQRGYKRHMSEKYGALVSFNRLVDSIPPESDAARRFRDDVEAYAGAPGDSVRREELMKSLARWQESAAALRPMLQSNSLLNEVVPAADLVTRLCQAGRDALGGKKPAGADSQTLLEEAARPHAQLLIAITPAIQMLLAMP